MTIGKDYIGVAAGALVFNKLGEVLMAKRGPKARNEIGKWEFTGGAVKFNEKRRDAAIREIKEEHGIDIEIIGLLGVVDHIIPEEGQHWIATNYIARHISGELKIVEDGKISQSKWFKLSDIGPEQLTIGGKLFYQIYKKKFGLNPPFDTN